MLFIELTCRMSTITQEITGLEVRRVKESVALLTKSLCLPVQWDALLSSAALLKYWLLGDSLLPLRAQMMCLEWIMELPEDSSQHLKHWRENANSKYLWLHFHCLELEDCQHFTGNVLILFGSWRAFKNQLARFFSLVVFSYVYINYGNARVVICLIQWEDYLQD